MVPTREAFHIHIPFDQKVSTSCILHHGYYLIIEQLQQQFRHSYTNCNWLPPTAFIHEINDVNVQCTGLVFWWIFGKLTWEEIADVTGNIADIIESRSWWWSYSKWKWRRATAINHDIDEMNVRCRGFLLWWVYTILTWQVSRIITGDIANIFLSCLWWCTDSTFT